MPKLNRSTQKILKKEEADHEVYIEKFKRKFLRAKKSLEISMIK